VPAAMELQIALYESSSQLGSRSNASRPVAREA
jgi:hypothetical protein